MIYFKILFYFIKQIRKMKVFTIKSIQKKKKELIRKTLRQIKKKKFLKKIENYPLTELHNTSSTHFI